MKEEYDFSNAVRNPYAQKLKTKKMITIRLDDEAISYFKQLASEMHIPYQTLINAYLKDCTVNQRKPTIQW